MKINHAQTLGYYVTGTPAGKPFRPLMKMVMTSLSKYSSARLCRIGDNSHFGLSMSDSYVLRLARQPKRH
jgi:hypothetical protein